MASTTARQQIDQPPPPTTTTSTIVSDGRSCWPPATAEVGAILFFVILSLSLSLSLSLHVGQLPTVAQELERKKKSISSTSDRPSVSCDLVRTKSHSFLMKLKNGRLDGENQTKQTNKQKKLESCRPTRENITWWCQFDRVSFEATE